MIGKYWSKATSTTLPSAQHYPRGGHPHFSRDSLFSTDKSRWDSCLEIARVAVGGCARWHIGKDLIHEVQDTLSKAWLLTGIFERVELAKRDLPFAGIRNADPLAGDVHAARLESDWRRFPLRNVARVWRHKLLKRQISRTNRKLPFKPSSGLVRYRRQPPSSNSSASFQVLPSRYSSVPRHAASRAPEGRSPRH
jgi:hypothetical protein